MSKYGVLAKTRPGSMWGVTTSWCKENDKPLVFDTYEQAAAEAQRISDSMGPINRFSDYFPKEISQEELNQFGITAPMDDTIRILVVEPHKAPYVANIANDYTAMQEIVGGCIEFVPLPDGDCHLYCNDEGKLDGLPGNRRMDNGDILCGTFFICADNGEGADASLSDEQMARYMERFGAPEQYTDDEAHQFTYTISAAGAVEYLRMLGLVEPEGDSEEFER